MAQRRTPGTRRVKAGITLPTNIDPGLRSFLESVEETLGVVVGFRGDPLDRAPSLRELGDIGLLNVQGGRVRPGSGSGSGGTTDSGGSSWTGPLLAPLDVTLSATANTVVVRWGMPDGMADAVSHTEVWAQGPSDWDEDLPPADVEAAQFIGSSSFLSLRVTSQSRREWRFFVRFIGKADQISPWHDIAGSVIRTPAFAQDVYDEVSDYLQGIAGTATDLWGYIGSGGVLDTAIVNESLIRAQAIADEAQARADGLSAEAIARAQDIDATIAYFEDYQFDPNSLLAQTITVIQGDVGDNAGAITSILNLTIDPASVLAIKFTTLEGDIGSAQGTITDILDLNISPTSALLSSITTLQGDVGDNAGAITSILNLTIDPASVLATKFTTLEGDIGDNSGLLTELATVDVTSTAALVQRFITTEATAGDAEASANLLMGAFANNDGTVSAIAGFEIDAAGNVAGLRVSGDASSSTIEMLANNYALWAPQPTYDPVAAPNDKDLILGYASSGPYEGQLVMQNINVVNANVDAATINGTLTANNVSIVGELDASAVDILGARFFGGQISIGLGGSFGPSGDQNYKSYIDPDGSAFFENAYVSGIVSGALIRTSETGSRFVIDSVAAEVFYTNNTGGKELRIRPTTSGDVEANTLLHISTARRALWVTSGFGNRISSSASSSSSNFPATLEVLNSGRPWAYARLGLDGGAADFRGGASGAPRTLIGWGSNGEFPLWVAGGGTVRLDADNIELFRQGSSSANVTINGLPPATVATSSDPDLTDYPIGTILAVHATSAFNRNAVGDVRLGSIAGRFNIGSGGTVVPGTWRARGNIINDIYLFQKTGS